MANPFGEKNIGPWEGQQVEYIPLDDLVLWTENPRDPLDGDYTNDDVIRRATANRDSIWHQTTDTRRNRTTAAGRPSWISWT